MQINIGMLGLGVVGSGVFGTLAQNSELIFNRTGIRFNVARVAVRDIGRHRNVDVPRHLLTDSVADILDDPEIQVVCELIGGVEPAHSYLERALNSGKSVVTANKEMMAKAGHDLLGLAQSKGLDFLFEGSVGGGIPIIQPIKQALAGNRITKVMGIVNGTTNYILTKMSRDGAGFADVLREAQDQGYAEADPASDVEGYDARYKCAILASIAFNTTVDVDNVPVEGITRIAKRDIEVANLLGYTIKLLGIGEDTGSGVRVRVHPVLLRSNHPLASVSDVYNAVFIHGEPVGDVMFYGRGAGSGPTGSAVVGDLIEIGRNMRLGAGGRLGCTCFAHKELLPMSTLVSKYFVRLTAIDRPKVLASVASVFGDFDVSIESVEQRTQPGAEAEIVIITHPAMEHNFTSAMQIMDRLSFVSSVDNWIRIVGE